MVQNRANILEIQNLSVSYGNISAIRKVNLEVHKGEIVALIGANGAGKSTLLAAVLGIHRAESGAILFKGQNITRRPTHNIVAAGIALVPEGRGILPMMTVIENLQLGAYQLKGDIGNQLNRVFELFPVLAERKNMSAGSLSGGQQQMLAIGRGLMAAPELIMMDEPSLGLAPIVIKEVFDMILDLKKKGQNILLSEQNAKKALQCADRGYVLETGSIVLQGTSKELASDPRVIQAYLGTID